jgi:hypothetical protein
MEQNRAEAEGNYTDYKKKILRGIHMRAMNGESKSARAAAENTTSWHGGLYVDSAGNSVAVTKAQRRSASTGAEKTSPRFHPRYEQALNRLLSVNSLTVNATRESSSSGKRPIPEFNREIPTLSAESNIGPRTALKDTQSLRGLIDMVPFYVAEKILTTASRG